ncbi:MAG: hypothetical protein Q8R37_00600 [Nanoarchaeota archaeon]|nr:hypothetical protein [Nanoarchaeota archaeon]
MRKVGSLLSLISMLNCSNLDYTPGGIAVNKNGYHPNMDMIDVKYDAVEHCLRENEIPILNGKEDIVVYIETDQEDIIPCPNKEYDVCQGYYCLAFCEEIGRIGIPENLRYLSHELSHHLRRSEVHDTITKTCGTSLDYKINPTYLPE